MKYLKGNGAITIVWTADHSRRKEANTFAENNWNENIVRRYKFPCEVFSNVTMFIVYCRVFNCVLYSTR